MLETQDSEFRTGKLLPRAGLPHEQRDPRAEAVCRNNPGAKDPLRVGHAITLG